MYLPKDIINDLIDNRDERWQTIPAERIDRVCFSLEQRKQPFSYKLDDLIEGHVNSIDIFKWRWEQAIADERCQHCLRQALGELKDKYTLVADNVSKSRIIAFTSFKCCEGYRSDLDLSYFIHFLATEDRHDASIVDANVHCTLFHLAEGVADFRLYVYIKKLARELSVDGPGYIGRMKTRKTFEREMWDLKSYFKYENDYYKVITTLYDKGFLTKRTPLVWRNSVGRIQEIKALVEVLRDNGYLRITEITPKDKLALLKNTFGIVPSRRTLSVAVFQLHHLFSFIRMKF